MRIAEAFRVAVGALRANTLRSALTMLGVVIGVAAVVILVAIGTGAKVTVERQVQGLGSNLILVVPGQLQFGSAPSASRLRLTDVDEVGRIVGDRNRVAASVASGENVRAGTKQEYATIQGVTETTLAVFSRHLSAGSYLSRSDVDTRRRVAVLGATTAQKLFGARNPVGLQVSIAGVRFRVIGVMSVRGSALGVDQDLDVHIPITTAQRLFATERIDALAVRAPDAAAIGDLGNRIKTDLQDRYSGQEFSAVTQEQILGVLGSILGLLTLVLAAIAGISLLVGGVGVSNIMLVSVRERTREIGLRKAVGARQRDIGIQFLIEAVLLTTVGGCLGIAIGVGVSMAVDALTPLPAIVTWWSGALAFGVSVAVGIIFGVVPARRAGRLDPVVALRTE
ncbi:MAG: permease [Actinomycetia bacterium]|nr:permease [Actinomycetes bacterium]MDQ1659823.1 putative transport system permease protein [Cryptosporangiaceae bacterium]